MCTFKVYVGNMHYLLLKFNYYHGDHSERRSFFAFQSPINSKLKVKNKV